MATPDINVFSEEDKKSYQEVLLKISNHIDGYMVTYPSSRDDMVKLSNAIGELNGFFRDGRQVWFARYRDIISDCFLKPEYTDIRNIVFADFHHLWTHLTPDDRTLVSKYGSQYYHVPNNHHKSPKRLVEDIDKAFRNIIRVRFGRQALLETISGADTITYYVRSISEEPLFRLSANNAMIQLEKLYREDTSEINTAEYHLVRLMTERSLNNY